MRTLVYLLCVATLASGYRIGNGDEVNPPFKYPFQAHLSLKDHSCGGSILDAGHILTARSCLFDAGNAHLKPEDVTVTVGIHEAPDMAGCTQTDQGQTLQVSDFIVRDDYEDFPIVSNNIAILKLASQIQLGEHAAPIDLAQQDMAVNDGDMMTVTGWGEKTDGSMSCALQEAQLSVRDDHLCEVMTQNHHDTTLCADSNKYMICSGDQGGPMFTSPNNMPVLVGLTSVPGGCDPKVNTTVFTRVSHFNSWIQYSLNPTTSAPPTTPPAPSPSTTTAGGAGSTTAAESTTAGGAESTTPSGGPAVGASVGVMVAAVIIAYFSL